LLDELLAADIRFIPTEDPYDPRVAVWLEEVRDELQTQGHKPYLLHLTGVTATVVACAYVDAVEEMVGQFDAQGLNPDYFYVTVGSGVTMAGLVLGFKHLGRPVRLVGVSSSAKSGFLSERIVLYANQASEILGLSTRVNAEDFVLHDQYPGTGYAKSYPAVNEAIQLTARNEGILLDPDYTGKCMHGLLDQINQGPINKDQTVVFCLR
jgi:1-aminocyclopropane-1-carboxylate deaminase/D-cysteine desulfhydrase-like pyridoxal-dependent ACC family enzyme